MCNAISCRLPQSARIKYNLQIDRDITYLNYFIFLLKKAIVQINNNLYFILADPPILQEIAKRVD